MLRVVFTLFAVILKDEQVNIGRPKTVVPNCSQSLYLLVNIFIYLFTFCGMYDCRFSDVQFCDVSSDQHCIELL